MPGAPIEERLSDGLAVVAANARRRAVRGGDREVDTAHLLHSLLESDPDARAFLGGGDEGAAKLLGYLAQRSIGYGMRWRHAEETGARRAQAGGARLVAGWSPAAGRAMAEALERAAARGEARADGRDLFAALASDAGCRAAEVLRATGFDLTGLAGAPTANVRCMQGDTPVRRLR